MNKESVLYERTIHTSYMKIPAYEEENLDVRIMLHRKIKGMIPVELCYINEKGQYWYDISGKQALDSFVKVNSLEYSLFELLILRICEQLELLEWNLLDENGLLIDPEFIFLNNKGEDISFVFYPKASTNLLKDLQKLMEYLLSKLNHADTKVVRGAYDLYEMLLKDSCQIQDLKYAILEGRLEEKKTEPIDTEIDALKVAEKECVYGQEEIVQVKGVSLQEQIEEKVVALYKRAKDILVRKPKKEIPTVIYPQDEEEKMDVHCHQTICIAGTLGEPRGVLMYEGIGDYPDFEMNRTTCLIGKKQGVHIQINRETISNVHAKIDYTDGYFIEDMNSTNGTFVNDEIVNYREKRKLFSGDVIRFADVKYRFL